MLNTLRFRLLVIFVSLAVLPLIVVAVLLGQRVFNTLEKDALDERRAEASLVRLEIEQFINAREGELKRLNEVQRLTNLSTENQRILLNNLMAYELEYQTIALVNANGQEQVRVQRGEVVTADDLVNRSGDPAFDTVLTSQESYISNVIFNEDLREPLLTIAVPILNLRSGEVGAVLIGDFRFKGIWDLLAAQEHEAGEDIYVTDGTGKVVAHANPSIVLSNTVLNLPDVDGRSVGLDGSEVLMARESILVGDQELIVVSEQSVSTALALADNSLQITGLITLGALLGALLLAFFMARWVARPIESLSDVAGKLTAGQYSERAPVSRRDEFGALATSFNQMAQAIQSRDDEIRQQANELKLALEQAQESSRLKSEFLSTMSHELRTPLNSVLGYTGLLLMGIRGKIDDEAKGSIQRVQASGEHLLSLINDVLDIAKIEAGRLDLVTEPVYLNKLLDKWRQQIAVLSAKKGLSLKTQIDPALPEAILGDEERLTQIGINLLSNAVKFTDAGTITLDLHKNGSDKWILQVSDTGIGIPPEAQEYIFDEFRQVDGSYSRAYQGTGLGLPIVRRISEAMGGTVTIESTLGQGSTFTVTLPLASTQEAQMIGA
jgi:signal transduction histidine kinase